MWIKIVLKSKIFLFVSDGHHNNRQWVIEPVDYVASKRGTHLVLYDGNTYTPNEKPFPGQSTRNWKCSMYYKSKCRARVITKEVNNTEVLRVAVSEHTHSSMFPQHKKKAKTLNRYMHNRN